MSRIENESLVDYKHLRGAIEALLLSSELPLTNQQIMTSLEFGSPEMYQKAINELNEEYRRSGRSFEIQSIAGGYQIYTLPKFHNYVERLWMVRKRTGLTRSALETLAIISYRQPITRVQIEEIRGVGSDSVLQGLLERGLTKITGRQSAPGRPILYGTTKEFLRYFGLQTIADLPRDKDFPVPQLAQSELFALNGPKDTPSEQEEELPDE